MNHFYEIVLFLAAFAIASSISGHFSPFGGGGGGGGGGFVLVWCRSVILKFFASKNPPHDGLVGSKFTPGTTIRHKCTPVHQPAVAIKAYLFLEFAIRYFHEQEHLTLINE